MHAPQSPAGCEDDLVERALEAKRVRLVEVLARMERVVVAYSGGVDSSYLMATAHAELGAAAVAVTAVSPSLARRELDAAKDLARRFGWRHELVTTREVRREEYARNDADRCYWCKTELFGVVEPMAASLGAEIAVGTNTGDLGDHRPGLRSARERGIRAPLVEAGLSKDDVRALSAALGLPTADKPASPCLASRFAYGVRVTPEGLRRVEKAEDLVRSYGFEVLRVRDHGGRASVEVEADDVQRAIALEAELARGLMDLGYDAVSIDPAGFRSGSLNAVLDLPRFAGSS